MPTNTERLACSESRDTEIRVEQLVRVASHSTTPQGRVVDEGSAKEEQATGGPGKPSYGYGEGRDRVAGSSSGWMSCEWMDGWTGGRGMDAEGRPCVCHSRAEQGTAGQSRLGRMILCEWAVCRPLLGAGKSASVAIGFHDASGCQQRSQVAAKSTAWRTVRANADGPGRSNTHHHHSPTTTQPPGDDETRRDDVKMARLHVRTRTWPPPPSQALGWGWCWCWWLWAEAYQHGSRLRRADVAVGAGENIHNHDKTTSDDKRRQATASPIAAAHARPGQACKSRRASVQVAAGSTVPNPRVAWNRVIGGPSSSLSRRVPIYLSCTCLPLSSKVDCSLAMAVASCRDAYDASLPWPRGGVGCMLPRVPSRVLAPAAAPAAAALLSAHIPIAVLLLPSQTLVGVFMPSCCC
ncbi:hypothetical protein COCMIDRAFT_28310 [Bipolaris oryzae ATCC 44560]|uniref:Uncharacterized protein n=1 Tax=Bipolaris oryzae ATCC 44560 TaxID=930090 RepID=W6ZI37_COCMI|nr:uncharacterized protein COCMIDRAFT_28310 [Bipolaris oryzae ATCC 44560]EUC43166.1 hypothetical protein COCMIDRAFT_28310 [Bipolaris oryzae ATCC 44560]